MGRPREEAPPWAAAPRLRVPLGGRWDTRAGRGRPTDGQSGPCVGRVLSKLSPCGCRVTRLASCRARGAAPSPRPSSLPPRLLPRPHLVITIIFFPDEAKGRVLSPWGGG